MGIRFIYGRSGSGKSTFCLNDINKKLNDNENNKLIYIVPEQYTFQRETLLLRKISEKGLLRAEVLSFKRMANKVFDECGGRVHNIIKDSGKSMLIYKILQEEHDLFQYFNRISREQGFTEVISKLLTEFKKYNITSNLIEDKLVNIEDEELKKKLIDLSLIYEKFSESLSSNTIDSDDELTFLANKLEHCNLFEGSEVWIDEFTTFTPQQLNVIRILAKQCKRINITLCMEEISNNESEMKTVFNPIKSTENRLINLMKEENIKYLKPIDLNEENSIRFRNSFELSHLEKYFYTYPFKIYNKKNTDIRLYKANNSYDEVQEIAREILRLVRDVGYRYRDISVVCRDIDNYEKITKVIFNEYNIPYFIDKKIDVLSNPLIILILSSIEVYLRNWSYESIFKYLKSGLTSLDRWEIDILENYILAHGIKGFKWTEEIEINEEDEDFEIKELMIRVREPLIKFHSSIKGKKKVIDVCKAIYDFLVNLDVFNKIEERLEKFEEYNMQDKLKEYEQVPGIVVEILDQMVDVLGEEVLEAGEIYKILNAGFENKEIGVIPVALDQVNIGDITRIKGRDVKALFIVGVNDGVLPSANKEEGILSDNDRDLLKDIGIELAATNKAKVFEEQFIVYTALTLASEFLMVSYPMADFEGKSLRPSIVIPRLKRIFPKLVEESDIYNLRRNNDNLFNITAPNPTFNEFILAMRRRYDKEEIEDYWKEVYCWYKNNDEFKKKAENIMKGLNYRNIGGAISKEKIRDLYSTDSGRLLFSVSRLEKYAECPFSYFIQYGLKAKDRKIYEFSAPDLGSFMHDILDGFTKRVKGEGISWSELDLNKCKIIVDELVKNKLEEEQDSILNSSKKFKYFTNRFKKVITRSVSIIAEQMKRGEFEIFSNEYVFGSLGDGAPIKLNLPSGEEVFLTGRVDRIDTLTLDNNTYVRVIDYKSGAKTFDLNELYYGIQIQLLVYLDAILKNSQYIMKKQAIPGAILYFKIDDPIIKSKIELEDDEIKEEILKKLKMNGLLLKNAELVRSMDHNMVTYSLIIPAAFKKDGDFSSTSSVVTEDEFNILREYVNKKMIELCEDMLSGKIKIEPCKKMNSSYCEYCSYSPICQFDTRFSDNKYKLIVKKDEEVIWQQMKEFIKEGKEDVGN